MWNYLKSDFEELISVVKEDSNVILEKLHDEKAAKKATAASKEAERRMFLEETYLIPLLPLDDNDDDDEMDDAERTAVEKFLNEFKVEEKTDEITNILQDYDVVKEYFEVLVPQEIPYEEFWSRFFYRCDDVRIQLLWDAQEAAAQQARAELVGSVSSFFGGAAKSLASTVKEVVSQKDGRPPFVMNTAVDEDDAEGEEEEEEELGWDDEDEEEEAPVVATKTVAAVATEPLGDSDTEQIVFHDEALENTKEQLKQAVTERDQLQQTVELLKKELASIKSAVPEASSSSSVVDARVVKEKDVEIASLKASLAQITTAAASGSNISGSGDEATAKIQELTQALTAKDREQLATTRALQDEIISLRAQLATTESRTKEDAADWKRQVEKSSETITSLTKQLGDVQAKLEIAQGEVHQLRADAERHNDGGKTSEDSGVPVGAPPIVTTTTTLPIKSDDESDDWGDGWD